jgi:hypothetical protein
VPDTSQRSPVALPFEMARRATLSRIFSGSEQSAVLSNISVTNVLCSNKSRARKFLKKVLLQHVFLGKATGPR